MTGVAPQSRVMIAGIQVGVVSKIWLDHGRARVDVKMFPGTVLYDDAASLKVEAPVTYVDYLGRAELNATVHGTLGNAFAVIKDKVLYGRKFVGIERSSAGVSLKPDSLPQGTQTARPPQICTISG